MSKSGKGTKVSDGWVAKQLDKYALNFDEADKEKNGKLEFRDIVFAMVAGGFRGSFNDAKRIFTELDANADKVVTKVEFLQLMKTLPKEDHKEMAMRRAFKLIDKDGNGSLTRDEIMDGIGSVELDAEAENMSNLLIGLVWDDDNKLKYEEFLQAWIGEFNKRT